DARPFRRAAVVEVPGEDQLLAGARPLGGGGEGDRLAGLGAPLGGLRAHLQRRALAQHDGDPLRGLEAVGGVVVAGAGDGAQEGGAGGGRVDDRRAVVEALRLQRLAAAQHHGTARRPLDFQVGEGERVGAGDVDQLAEGEAADRLARLPRRAAQGIGGGDVLLAGERGERDRLRGAAGGDHRHLGGVRPGQRRGGEQQRRERGGEAQQGSWGGGGGYGVRG